MSEPSKPTGPAGAGQPPQGGPRIHVDSDWKREAQAEKERLVREVEAVAAAKAAAAKAPTAPAAHGPAGMAEAGLEDAGEEEGQLPPASFTSLVQMLATQAAVFMSDQADPETGMPVRNLELAKHNIDLLRVLEEKTKGNLTDPEKRLLETLLYELLMAYVSAAS
jgi:hypothetical protein